MNKVYPALFLLLAALSSVVACQAVDPEDMHITGKQLAALIEEVNPPAIIDVRSTAEFRKGHVPGAIHMPFWLSFARADELTIPRDQPVVVYCAHGPRAGVAKFALEHNGFTQVLYLEGHMSGWHKAGLPEAK